MLRRPLFVIVIVLLVTNIITLVLLGKDKDPPLEIGKGSGKKDSVASVNGQDIRYDDWIQLLTEDYGEQHLQELIDRTIVDQLAKQKGIKINEKLIDHGISLLTTMQGVMEKEAYEKQEKKWRKDLLYRYQLEELLAEGEHVSTIDIEDHYETYQKQYNFPASMQFSHIIVENKEIANKVIQELSNGASFQLLAMEYSTDEGTNANGGYLGYFTRTNQPLPANYYDIGADMKEDSYSEPIQIDGGVAIIYVHRKLPEIVFSYKEIEDEIRRELALKDMGQSLTAKKLWETSDIKWLYE